MAELLWADVLPAEKASDHDILQRCRRVTSVEGLRCCVAVPLDSLWGQTGPPYRPCAQIVQQGYDRCRKHGGPGSKTKLTAKQKKVDRLKRVLSRLDQDEEDAVDAVNTWNRYVYHANQHLEAIQTFKAQIRRELEDLES